MDESQEDHTMNHTITVTDAVTREVYTMDLNGEARSQPDNRNTSWGCY